MASGTIFDGISDTFSGGFDYVRHFVSWLLDPARMLDGGASMLATIIKWIVHFFPGSSDVGRIEDAMNWLQSGIFQRALGLAAYMVSPLVTPALTVILLKCYMELWLITALISIAFMIKGWLTGTGA